MPMLVVLESWTSNFVAHLLLWRALLVAPARDGGVLAYVRGRTWVDVIDIFEGQSAYSERYCYRDGRAGGIKAENTAGYGE
jgi:hypothetical protein